jgi:hypothetical protein
MHATTIFDKSFVQMLNEDELFEFCVFFQPVGTPILRKEILADLDKPSTAERNVNVVLKSLCAKVARSGLEPMEYRRAALTELATGEPIAMHGAVLIDLSAPHVTVHPGGGVYVDGRQLQWDWRRWEAGEFTDEERAAAVNHRRELEEYDPEGFRKRSKPWAQHFFGQCKTVEALIAKIDSLIDDPAFTTQELILGLTLNWLSATKGFHAHLLGQLRSGQIKRVKDYAPFATSITRITLTYQFGLARGFFGPRRSDMCDLEYLYYSPFCKFFVSNDRLHKSLWPATTTNAMFCNGKELQSDLGRRAKLRKEAPEKVAGMYPIPLENSIITAMFQHLRDRRASGKAT